MKWTKNPKTKNISFIEMEELQRGGHQREKKHIKDAFCIECKEITKNIEVRYCDSFDEMMQKAEKLHREYYSGKAN